MTFDLLEPAAILALEYIDAVMGHGKEFFGLEVRGGVGMKGRGERRML